MTASAARFGGTSFTIENIAKVLEQHDDFRVLRRLPGMTRSESRGVRPDMLAGCALQISTTGLDPRRDAIIELAIQRFWAAPDGRILMTGGPQRWTEDPGVPIAEDVSRRTGLVDDDVSGRRIVDALAGGLIADADFVVAHDVALVRPFVDRRLPHVAGMPWVCTLRDVDWSAHARIARPLGEIMTQLGWFYDPHHAGSDVTALLHLLEHRAGDGGTVLTEALSRASRPGWIFEADGAHPGALGSLQARGYRCRSGEGVWFREISCADFDVEYEWAVLHVYGGTAQPRFMPVTWRERYA